MKREVTKIDQFIGWVGALFIVLAYLLLTLEVVVAKDVAYNLMNLFGGAMIAYRVWVDRNYSNLFLEIVFIAVAIIALSKGLF